ncbi:MAG: dephospho-CoA kinase [Gammaproteobacteria bacterium]|nr:dephospho-CoA kinase [Gammaproteobacteria bacterium]MCY4210867.1 dephospho-CoA kinase [Gammaproteobacteria bacterium]MCY4282629.1 dephospho-CoA kinase [Gammaproteobacteria bacterium]MCY4337557.1 dephospho-CoA kinase [Gammaproteobacteria bacterium]
MPAKQLWLVVGGNGAGKSTFYRNRLAPLGIPFVNADLIARELFPEAPELHSYKAMQIVEEMRDNLLVEGRSFCYETVFSHPSKVDFVGKAKALGYEVILVMVHLELTELNKARVAQRVEEGGHDVPDDKIEARIPRLLRLVKAVIPLCDHAYLLDNSLADNPFVPVLTMHHGQIEKTLDDLPLPDWARQLTDL